jgi:hypothetical protein
VVSRNDLKNGAKHQPDLLEQYAALQDPTGKTMYMNRLPMRELVR